jgi:hypothetical protein
MRLSHASSGIDVRFDDPNLVGVAGLVPVAALAARAGLGELVGAQVRINAAGGANPALKVPAIVAGMAAGADSIDDLDLLRHGGMDRLFAAVRAPSTIGTFLRTFTFGHVRQLDAVFARFTAALAAHTPVLPGAGAVCFVDIDDTVRETYGHHKQGAGYGYSKVKGLNALVATASTPIAAPMMVGARLRKGSTASARGAARLVADALVTTKGCGGTGLVITRMDSAFYNHKTLAAVTRHGARFSVTARMDKAVTRAIAAIPDDAWVPIRYPEAIYDEAEQRWISDAEVAETSYTAFTSRPAAEQVTARLIVRRVKRLTPKKATAGQDPLFDTWRHHAIFTNSPMSMLQAESQHRGHAIIETVIADLKNGPLAHLPSGKFTANAAWLVLAAITYNLLRAAGALASVFHAKATTATIRRHLINIPARTATSARRLTLHLPTHWPWEAAWQQLFDRTTRPA